MHTIENRLFRQIYESNMIGLLLSSFDGKIVEANEAFLSMVGYSREDLKAGLLRWDQLTPPEFMDVNKKMVAELQATGVSIPYEKDYFRKDGSRLTVIIGSTLVKNHPKFDAFTYVIDISDKKKIQHDLAQAREELEERVEKRTSELKQMNSFLDSLIEFLPNMIFVKDAKDLKFVRFNKAGEELIGISRKDLLGKSDYDFFPKEQADNFTKNDKEVLASRKVFKIEEEKISTRTGEKLLSTKKIPLLDEDGNPKYLLGISEDITERKKIEKERIELAKAQIAASEAQKTIERLKFLSDTTAVLSSSRDYETVLKNLSDFLVSRIADWCSIQMVEDEKKLKQLVISHKDPSKLQAAYSFREKFNPNPDAPYGALYSIENRKSVLIKDFNDEILQNVSTSKHEIDQLKNFEMLSAITVPLKVNEEIIGVLSLITTKESGRKYNETDLHLVEELTEKISLAIDNLRLYDQTLKANQVKDEFLATLSHELRTPLNIIQGYSELLKENIDEYDSQEIRNFATTIHRNAKIQGDIINDLLDVSRIVTGKLKINPAMIPPTKIVNDVIHNLQLNAEVKGIKILCNNAHSPAVIMADETRFQQIVWNLVSNAIKFTSSNGKIEILSTVKDNQYYLEVKDNGIGIDPNFLPLLFQRFRQEDASMRRRYEGLGLGLSIVKYLTEAHGGSVEAFSEGKNKGSRFSVRLPLPLLTSSSPELSIKSDTTKSTKNAINLKNRTILLIEDSVDTRNFVVKILRKYGAHVLDVGSARDARDLLDHHVPDLILCDIGMAEEDGTEFIQKLRNSHQKDIPAIALTAYARDEEKKHFLSVGFQSHISKPISIENFLGEIARVLRKHQPAIRSN